MKRRRSGIFYLELDGLIFVLMAILTVFVCGGLCLTVLLLLEIHNPAGH
jgi:hypothetical protein